MIGPLVVSLMFAVQTAGDSSSLTLGNSPSDALLKNGQYFQYIRNIEQQLMQSPSDAGLHASLAVGYYLVGQQRFCEEEIEQALALLQKPPAPPVRQSLQIHYLAGRLAMENTQYPIAFKHLEAALQLDPANSKIEYFLGICLQAMNRQESASTHFERACRAALYSWPCRALAEIELDNRNAFAAQRYAAQAIQLESTSGEAQLIAGKAAQALGETSEAISFFRKAADLDQTWEVPHYFLAHLYQKLPGKSAEAARELTRYQELYNASQ